MRATALRYSSTSLSAITPTVVEECLLPEEPGPVKDVGVAVDEDLHQSWI